MGRSRAGRHNAGQCGWSSPPGSEQWLVALLLVTVLSSPLLAATPSEGASAAHGLAVDVTAGPARLVVAPTPAVAGSSPPSYQRRDSIASVEASSPALGTVASTGLLSVAASSSAPAGDGAAAS